jgi:pimeloyl-ACP methyl ester carboxylesterase
MKGKINLISTWILLFFFTSSTAADPPRPLVFIPGILGTTLADTAGRIVWGDAWSLTRLPSMTIKDGPKDPNDNLRPSAPIQQIAILGPWKVKQYSSLRETLKGLGYELGKNYVEFPYDWRQSNFTTASKFAAFADSDPVLKAKEFDIIAHSMGGLVAQIYAKTTDQKKRRVRRLINMGVPFFGSVNRVVY